MKKEDIEHLSQLTRIELSSKEKEVLEKDFESILDHINQIKSVSEFIDATTDTATGDVRSVFREDDAKKELSADKVVSLFPKTEEGYLVVKKVLEQ